MRVKALETLLTEKGLLDPAAIDALVETYETKIGPRNGARVVARAWTDPDYKAEAAGGRQRKAIAELGFSGVQGEDMVVVENTGRRAQHGRVHALLLLPVADARAAAHLVQERALPGPRGDRSARRVLEEFGVELSEDVELRVWDSNAELRYLVLPQRPAGTEGMSEDELAELVSRDSMIGTALADAPAG